MNINELIAIIKNKLAEVRNIFHPFYNFGILSVLDKNYYGKAYILRVDGIYIDAFNFVGDSQKLNKKIFDKISNSKGIVFISNFSKTIVEKFYHKKLPQNIIIHNKVPLDQYKNFGENARNLLGIDKNQTVLITAAKWRRHKRLEETIKFLNILNQNKKKFKLIVLGENNNNQGGGGGLVPQTNQQNNSGLAANGNQQQNIGGGSLFEICFIDFYVYIYIDMLCVYVCLYGVLYNVCMFVCVCGRCVCVRV